MIHQTAPPHGLRSYMPGPRVELGWAFTQGILSPSRLTSFATPALDGATKNGPAVESDSDANASITAKAGAAVVRGAMAPRTGLLPSTVYCRLVYRLSDKSGKRDSNPRPQPWQGCALPTELFPQLIRGTYPGRATGTSLAQGSKRLVQALAARTYGRIPWA